uniref:Putative secreted peptide n=1 Tax=Anopheles braziliensis TaxID=58242 RepID=A0A2M3ZW34_9DIPT
MYRIRLMFSAMITRPLFCIRPISGALTRLPVLRKLVKLAWYPAQFFSACTTSFEVTHGELVSGRSFTKFNRTDSKVDMHSSRSSLR